MLRNFQFFKFTQATLGGVMTLGYAAESLLPDGRIFRQITEKRPQKIVHGRKKLEALKWQNLSKSDRKEAQKTFLQ
jgi:hypothetical protein